MNKTSAHKEKNSLRTFFLFCSVVLILITGSLGIKLFSSIKDSIYDPSHNFIIGIKTKDTYSLSSLDPTNKRVSTLKITTDGKENRPDKILGIIPDIEVVVNHDRTTHFRDILPSLLFRSRSLTWFDVARMYLLSNSFEEKREEIKLSKLKNSEFTPSVNFGDPEVIDEQVSVGIVNATGEIGVGVRLEKVLVGYGGTVISVTTSQQPKDHSEIQTASLDSYTARRLKSLLHIPLTKTSEAGISDILIILGKDILLRDLF